MEVVVTDEKTRLLRWLDALMILVITGIDLTTQHGSRTAVVLESHKAAVKSSRVTYLTIQHSEWMLHLLRWTITKLHIGARHICVLC